MKIQMSPSFIVSYTPSTPSNQTCRSIQKTWEGVLPLFFGSKQASSGKWMVERCKAGIRIRDLSLQVKQVFSVATTSLPGTKPVEFVTENGAKFVISAISRNWDMNVSGKALDWNSFQSDALADSVADSKLFQKSIRQAAVLFLSVLLVTGVVSRVNQKNESAQLIPPQYARLILQKQKVVAPTVKSNSKNIVQAKDTAIVQAVHSRSVQRSISSLISSQMSMNMNKMLAGAGGKSVGALLNSASGLAAGGGALRGIASALQAGHVATVGSMGGGSGYLGNGGQGGAVGVANQGNSFVALDTSKATVEEGLTREEVAKVIHSHMNEIRYCYESAVLQNSNLEGKLLVDFKIIENGSVKNANAKESSVGDSGVGECVIRKLITWKFPEPRGKATVAISYPFLFKTLRR